MAEMYRTRFGLRGAILISCLLLLSCPNPSGGDPGGDPDLPAATIDKFFWGSWVRMDGSNEPWYVSGSTVAVASASPQSASSTAASLALPGLAADKVTDNLLKVSPAAAGSLPYFLFRSSGANATIGATVLGSSGTSGSRALSGISNINIILQNTLNPLDVHKIHSESDGSVSIPEVILGDSYSLVVPTQPGVPEPIKTEVKPVFDGESVGSLNLVDAKQNFKVSYSIAGDPEFLYAGQSYSLTIRIKNIGTEEMLGANYAITPPAGMKLDDTPLSSGLGSIKPGTGEKSITITMTVPSLDKTEKNFEVPVSISSTYPTIVEWKDSVSLRFFRERATIHVRTAWDEIQGMVISPDRSSYPFKTYGQSGSITLPARDKPYILALSGADYENETPYTVSMNQAPASNGEGLIEPELIPNDDELHTTPLFEGATARGYLGPKDLDFFSLYPFAESEALTFNPPAGRYDRPQSVVITSGAGGTIRYTLDDSDPTLDSLSYSGVITVDSDMTIRASCFGGSLSDKIIFSSFYQYACQISFDSGDGTTIPIQVIRHGNLASRPVDPMRANYGFAGWYKDSNYVTAWDFDVEEVNSDLVLYAKWLPLRTLSFNSLGGSAVPSAIVIDGGKISAPTKPTKDGYSFGGWYIDTAYSKPWDFANDAVSGDSTLYARWLPLRKVTFDCRGGSGVSAVLVGDGETVEEPTAPIRSAFAFAGWYADSDCVTKWNFATATVKMDITLYAKWLSIYSIVFNSQGGSSMATVEAAEGALLSRPADPTKSGNAFAGWYKESSLAAQWAFDLDTVSQPTTLYAKWIPIFTLSFDSRGGSSVSAIQVQQGTLAQPPAEPSWTGRDFNGWFREATCSTKWDFAVDRVAADATLYAGWTLKSYLADFDSHGGSAIAGATTTYGSLLTAPAEPTRAGMVLVGWYADSSYSTPWNFATDTVSGPITLHARWGYQLIFDGQSGNSPASQRILPGGLATVPAAPTRTGYTFMGWFKESSCSTAWTFSSDTVSSQTTLYAKWGFQVNYYTYSSYYYTGVVVSPSSTLSAPANPYRSGYTFMGWYKESTCVTPWSFASDTVNSAQNLWGKWGYTVSFYDRSAQAAQAQVILPGTKAAAPSVSRSGCAVAGWYREATFVNQWDFAANTVSGATALYVKWIPSIDMVQASAGSFSMGQADITAASPVHQVTLSAFKISAKEITHSQFHVLMETNGYTDEFGLHGNVNTAGPEANVTWFDAVAFCNKLSEAQGLNPVYTIANASGATTSHIDSATVTYDISKNGYRLPTEAEWEYAYRGGTSTEYHWGSAAATDYEWYSGNSGYAIHLVGQLSPNPWGLYDMGGNVIEWCQDWYGTYTAGAQSDPTGPSSGAYRVARGGQSNYGIGMLRPAYRSGSMSYPTTAVTPQFYDNSLGFRVVRR